MSWEMPMDSKYHPAWGQRREEKGRERRKRSKREKQEERGNNESVHHIWVQLSEINSCGMGIGHSIMGRMEVGSKQMGAPG